MTGQEGHAFLSYARVDKEQVDPVQAKLEGAGIPVWRDTVLKPGQFWADQVEEAISVNAFVFIAFFSKASLLRAQGFQFTEIRRAIERFQSRNPDYPWLILVRLDDCEIPKYDLGAGQRLADLWHADLFGPGYDRELGRLVEAVVRSQKQLEDLEERQRQEAAARAAAAGPVAVAPPSETQPPPQPGRRRAGALGRWRSGGTRALVATVAVLAVAGGVLVYVYVVPPAAAPGSASGSASDSASSSVPASASAAASVSTSDSAPASASGQARSATVSYTAHPFTGSQYGFGAPQGIAVDGRHVWVANFGGNSVTELNAADGSLVKVLSGGSYGFAGVSGVDADGTHVWVAEDGGLVEVNAADDSVVRRFSNGHGETGGWAIALDGGNIWVAGYYGNSVAELNAATGQVEQDITEETAPQDGLDNPDAIAVAGGHVWVANGGGDTVAELNAADGKFVQLLYTFSYDIEGPMRIVAVGSHVWIANNLSQSLTEVNADTGKLENVVLDSAGSNFVPNSLASNGTDVWIGEFSGSLTEVNADTGKVVQNLPAAYGLNDPTAIAAFGSDLWVGNNGNNSVTELSPR